MIDDEALLRQLMRRRSGGLGQINNGAVKPEISISEIVRPPAPAGSGGGEVCQDKSSDGNSNQQKESR